MKPGKVYIMGVGPGDYKLMTLKAAECIAKADVVVYDRLGAPKVLTFARQDAEFIYVGKRPGFHAVTQEGINDIIAKKALEGKAVARVKGGDPFLFGRGGEEAEALLEHGIEFEVIPGITSAVSVPAYAGIPVTHREYSSSLHIITGHEKPGREESLLNYAVLAKLEGTLVFLMGVKNLPEITGNLLKFGKQRFTPAAVIERGTTHRQRVVSGTLETIAALAAENNIKSPAVTVIGEVADLHKKLDWYPRGTLAGKTVLVTRTKEQAGVLSQKIEERGGETVEFSTLAILEPEDFSAFDQFLSRLSGYDWLVFSSTHGVDAFFKRLKGLKKDLRLLAGVRFCAVGDITARRLAEWGFIADYVPERFTTADALEGLREKAGSGEKVLLVRSDIGGEEFLKGFKSSNIHFDDLVAYRTVAAAPGKPDRKDILELLERRELDFITFASSSSVKSFAAAFGRENLSKLREAGARVVCIGPVTAETAAEAGFEVAAVADSFTIEGLTAKLEELSTGRIKN